MGTNQSRPDQTRPVQTLVTKLMPRRRQTPDAVVAIVALLLLLMLKLNVKIKTR